MNQYDIVKANIKNKKVIIIGLICIIIFIVLVANVFVKYKRTHTPNAFYYNGHMVSLNDPKSKVDKMLGKGTSMTDAIYNTYNTANLDDAYYLGVAKYRIETNKMMYCYFKDKEFSESEFNKDKYLKIGYGDEWNVDCIILKDNEKVMNMSIGDNVKELLKKKNCKNISDFKGDNDIIIEYKNNKFTKINVAKDSDEASDERAVQFAVISQRADSIIYLKVTENKINKICILTPSALISKSPFIDAGF